jgi:MFS family permease
MIGALIGPNVATLTKDLIPSVIYSGSYIFLSILTIIPFFLFLFYSNEKLTTFYKTKSYNGRNYLDLFLQPKFIQAVVVSGLAYCTMSFLMTATPISMHVLNHISLEKTGFVIIFHILAMFLPSLITGNLIKKFGNNNIMYSGVVILFISILFNFYDQSFFNYLVGLILLGLGWNFLFIAGTSLLITSYEPEEKFRAQGMNDFIVFSTQALGALTAGLLLSFFGWKLINILCIPLLIIIILTIFISDKKQKSIIKLQ